MKLVKKIKDTITRHSMIASGNSVLIGLSGGPDSTCLAVILDKLRKDFNLSLSALYVNHGLRPDEAEREEAFCRALCEKYSIGFHSRSVDVRKKTEDEKMNIHEAARELRYRAFAQVAMELKASRIALGHTADDQAETVLMRLFRGSGRKGLSGIPPVRGIIVRPLINIERSEIENYLTETVKESFMIDSSNLKEDYFRNWLRLNILPEIKERNPSVIKDINIASNIVREEDEYLDIVVTKTMMRMISRKSETSIELFVTPLASTERPILRRLLRRALDAVTGLRGIGFTHIEDIIHLIKKGRAGDSINLPKNIRAIKEYSLLKITAEPHHVIKDYELDPPGEISIKESGATIKARFGDDETDGKAAIVIDSSKVRLPLRVRHRKEGDFFFPAGFGKRKKLQDYFTDEKVPRDMRDSVPIIVSGNDIIWVAGYRADNRFMKTEDTKKPIVLELINPAS